MGAFTPYLNWARAQGWIIAFYQHLCDPKVGWKTCGKINVFIISIFSLIHCQFPTWYLSEVAFEGRRN
jgi:hypothetical protein